MKNAIIILAVLLLVGAVGYTLIDKNPSFTPVFGGAVNTSVDVIGTRVGTTTTAVHFTDNVSTSSYISFIGNEIDSAIYTFYPTAASSSGANVQIQILGSNDTGCDTAATSTTHASYVATDPLTTDIYWFDLGGHIKDLANSAAITAATTTISWVPTSADTGRQIILEDINNKCLKIEVSASSTDLWTQLTTKAFN